MKLKDQIAVVTGGSRGIGYAVVRAFLKEGAEVVLCASRSETAERAVSQLKAELPEARVWGIWPSLEDPEQVRTAFDRIGAEHGRIDILVNNAGIQIREWATDFKVEDFDKVLAVNLRAYYLASRAAARYMKEQGGGSIVCISSGNSERYTTRRSAYNISKAAVNGLVGTLGVEWGRFNVRINGVAPGYVMTDMIQKGINEGIIDIDNIMLVIPMKRLLQPEEIASSVCFLASDEASGITGQVLFTDGGWNRAGLPEKKDL